MRKARMGLTSVKVDNEDNGKDVQTEVEGIVA